MQRERNPRFPMQAANPLLVLPNHGLLPPGVGLHLAEWVHLLHLIVLLGGKEVPASAETSSTTIRLSIANIVPLLPPRVVAAA